MTEETSDNAELREQVRARYARAATAVKSGTRNADLLVEDSCCGGDPANRDATQPAGESSCCESSCCADTQVAERSFGAGLYDPVDADGLPIEAIEASLGCGNPTAVAELRAGERVLDLGSGGGVDVLLSAKRVGPTGFAYGVDMTDEMLELAEANKAKAGLTNVEFLKGTIEEVPLSDAAVDVVISNCVVNLSTDKPAVLAEMFRVLTPGGRIGISDVVAEDHLTVEQRAERGSYVGCIAGAFSRTEYLDGLAEVGFVDASVEFTHEAVDGMHAAIIRATKPTPPEPAASCV